MSLLRDGIHRRAPLTARFGKARFGAARFGFCPGQSDFGGLTREIKNQALVSEGPFYVWKERLPTQPPFSGLVEYPPVQGLGRLLLNGSSTSSLGYSCNLLLGASSTSALHKGATPANLLLGASSFTNSVAALLLDASS